MYTTNSQTQTHSQRNRRTMSLCRMVICILCLSLLWGVTASIKTEANHPLLPAPQPTTPAEVNRIEQAATPHAFASISLSNNPGQTNLNLNGQILLGEQSDGLDPARERLVIAQGSSLMVLEPGSLRPAGQSNRVWTYQNPSHPGVRKVILQRQTAQSWQFEISSRAPMPENQRFYLRIGNDWGGINLGTREMLLQMQPALNLGFQSQATIGSSGGTVQTTDASGIVISLSVPPGALAEETLITVTPLESSPLVAPSSALHPGVKFEPEGLQFAVPATLTLDFSATAQEITNKDFIFLMTSPMTMVPLYGSASPATKTLSALVHHFSEVQPGAGESSLSDLAAWANAALASGESLTLEELQSIAALAAVQQQQGCGQDCIDVDVLAQRATESITALVAQNCANDTASPTDDGLGRYIELEVMAQQLGADVPAIRTCMEGVMRALIEKAATEGMDNPSDTTLQRLITLWGRAEQLSFPNLVTLARQKTEDVFRALIDSDGGVAAADPSDANLQRLLDLKARAQLLGFPNRERQALVKVAAGVHVIISRASAQCATNEVAARREFLRAQTWHAAVSLDPSVDPTLSQAIQDAIDNCGGPEMRVKLLDFNGWFFDPGTFAIAVNTSGTIGQLVRLNPADDPSALPLRMKAEADGSRMEWELRRPEPNVLAWDVTASSTGAPFVQVNTRGSVLADLTFSRPGVLRIEANSQWLQTLSAGSWIFMAVEGGSAVNLLAKSRDFRNVQPDFEIIRPSATINVAAGSTIRLSWNLHLSSYGEVSGQGRAMTITFTPQQ